MVKVFSSFFSFLIRLSLPIKFCGGRYHINVPIKIWVINIIGFRALLSLSRIGYPWATPSLPKKLVRWSHPCRLISHLSEMVLTLISSKGTLWPIIKKDFYNLCYDFHAKNVFLQSLNGSYITLIPKTDGPTKVNDFRLISLLNTFMKIITILLANIIHKNPYGFIQSRMIAEGDSSATYTQKSIWFHPIQDDSELFGMGSRVPSYVPSI